MSRCPSPSCGSDKAYIGLNAVECPDAGCRHFSPKLAAELQPARKVVVMGAPQMPIHSRPVTIPDLHAHKITITDAELQNFIDEAMQPARRLTTKDGVGVTVAPLTPATRGALEQIYLDYKASLNSKPQTMTTVPVGTPAKSVLIPDVSEKVSVSEAKLQDCIEEALQPLHILRSIGEIATPYPTMTPTLPPQEGLLYHLDASDGFDLLEKKWNDLSGNENHWVVGSWDRLLTDTETRQVRDYVHQRWGIPVAGPKHEVETVD